MQNPTTVCRLIASPEDFGFEISPETAAKIKIDLKVLESTGNGVGFIFIESLMSAGGDDIASEILSLPVFKVRGEWIVITDSNVCDIARGLINILADDTDSQKSPRQLDQAVETPVHKSGCCLRRDA